MKPNHIAFLKDVMEERYSPQAAYSLHISRNANSNTAKVEASRLLNDPENVRYANSLFSDRCLKNGKPFFYDERTSITNRLLRKHVTTSTNLLDSKKRTIEVAIFRPGHVLHKWGYELHDIDDGLFRRLEKSYVYRSGFIGDKIGQIKRVWKAHNGDYHAAVEMFGTKSANEVYDAGCAGVNFDIELQYRCKHAEPVDRINGEYASRCTVHPVELKLTVNEKSKKEIKKQVRKDMKKYNIYSALKQAISTQHDPNTEECKRSLMAELTKVPNRRGTPFAIPVEQFFKRVAMSSTNTPKLINPVEMTAVPNFVVDKTVMDMGAVISALGEDDHPVRLNGEPAAEWLAEDSDLTAKAMTFDADDKAEFCMVGFRCGITRRLFQQMTPENYQMIMAVIQGAIYKAVSDAVIDGDSSANQPVGLFENTDIRKYSTFATLATPTAQEMINFVDGYLDKASIDNPDSVPTMLIQKSFWKHITGLVIPNTNVPLLNHENQTILGLPFAINRKLSDTKPMLMGDFSQIQINTFGDLVLNVFMNNASGKHDIYGFLPVHAKVLKSTHFLKAMA